MIKKSKEQKAREHAKWFAEVIEYVYYQAFLHGYKHGKDDTRK